VKCEREKNAEIGPREKRKGKSKDNIDGCGNAPLCIGNTGHIQITQDLIKPPQHQVDPPQ
jgi:hypothetical protein